MVLKRECTEHCWGSCRTKGERKTTAASGMVLLSEHARIKSEERSLVGAKNAPLSG
jgi:hypothetical protein